jgi:hypothetical protein
MIDDYSFAPHAAEISSSRPFSAGQLPTVVSPLSGFSSQTRVREREITKVRNVENLQSKSPNPHSISNIIHQ